MSAKQPGAPAPERTERSSLIAAGLILLIAGLGFAFLPRLMLALGTISPFLAAAVGTLFVAAFFLVFWLRARVQRRRDGG
ncbi:hypothetical protein BJF92_16450 [Rhizobium rhizosphaerae]|uniref:Uncharacterized protein n=1 Tax=Xaviernesmea rhizosphaerae TaxID=1672749 RepID=A0A1Q9APS5_9HYPH|nr:hypothetical protein [Xaviernesmea rhizosphaerae]OLP57418.1 hypothetical protein BJF92_16450 [Xaviernesmea rhizosphaerae]OQP86356.1 hypothetical protein BTR14_11035 [Xaviernesmea rhizosphaerae]